MKAVSYAECWLVPLCVFKKGSVQEKCQSTNQQFGRLKKQTPTVNTEWVQHSIQLLAANKVSFRKEMPSSLASHAFSECPVAVAEWLGRSSGMNSQGGVFGYDFSPF